MTRVILLAIALVTAGFADPFTSTASAQPITPAEEKLWNDYLKELHEHERNQMRDVWRKADEEGRRKLVKLLAQMRLDVAKKGAEEKKRLAELKKLRDERRKVE